MLAHSDRAKLYTPVLRSDHLAKILLHIRTQSFVDNTEYFNKIMEGETIFGFHFSPGLECLIAKYMGVNIGLIWNNHFGQKKPWSGIRPLLSTYYKDKQKTFVIGIYSLQDYPPILVEPLLDPHRLLRRPFMEGLHFRIEKNESYVAGWLDWLTLLSQKEARPEAFTVHLDAGYHASNLQKTMSCKIPFQLAIYHLGGQSIPVKAYSLFCGASGFSFVFRPPNSFLKQTSCASYLLLNGYIKEIDRPSKRGWGQLHMIDCVLPFMGLTLSYWYGANFSSENMGYPLYQSIRIKDNTVVHHETIRSLLFLSLYKAWMVYPAICIQMAFRPYYDCKNRLLEYGLSFTLCFSGKLQLMRLRCSYG